MKNMIIGFIGQGFIGKNYANDFEERGFNIVRYAKEEPYKDYEDKIKNCRVVFIAVPTPTTPEGFSLSIIKDVIPLTSPDTIVVIKSTLLPGSTRYLQSLFTDRIILHSPEFLSEKTASIDAAFPFSNIVGIPINSPTYIKSAEFIHSILAPAPYKRTVNSDEAEFIKYTHNCAGYSRIIFFNLMYDLSKKFDVNWNVIRDAMGADPFITDHYSQPISKNGRGAGGHCFIKDFAAFSQLYQEKVGDKLGTQVLKSMEEKNNELLRNSKKDIDLLNGVYGEPKIYSPEREKSFY